MIYLSGAVRREIVGGRSDLGLMMTPLMGNRPDLSRTAWAADNGCFSQPHRFDLDEYLQFLAERPAETCLFATAPDVVGDAAATWERSRDVLPQLRALGYRAALVAQDGIEAMAIEWDAFDALFIGGSTEWKLSDTALALVREAKRRGKWVHVGRVNSLRRLRLFDDAGADSADGTYIAFGGDRNYHRVLGWLDHLKRQPSLVGAA